MSQRPPPVQQWHVAVARNDLSEVEPFLAEDVVFMSPAVHMPQQGKPLVTRYLRAALVVLNTPSFRYVDEWLSPRSAVLEFEVELDGVHLNGIDLIRWNDAEQITTFKVMVRPLKGLNAIVPLMGEQLKKGDS
ncbi:nuclear transport factor 2 family protein [Burkholderia vietnamiensis]|uniref:Nuclear transport factor 2 family protein n=1 Tax=Burkholderia vietnamiensis TaxID=60552 RepID=A0AAW7T0T0_BURVI|nr:nuclear transport factor 2 family protein [Burkholderia vietnamiensis]MBH9645871.1 nuclear transport factor 2 family protein [Burkholderia vietnamiensis]MBR8008820.1 nuclear transport factor 2 family protein [Burkholderia vietnamiensis]MDN7551321.1 nuclear transport factor 2 family protein [Burkholderia vietnamiensis]MDN7795135.1 nuclear transport factor 2 family protein [Burkholderia vietnamiensis]MDN8045139.1 nuclear transport factor 2 family protein [Burkholderia vietnamiensis]